MMKDDRRDGCPTLSAGASKGGHRIRRGARFSSHEMFEFPCGRDAPQKRLMDEFEWIGISNNEAIVRHRRQGHVYRYRPNPEAGWRRLVPSRTEMGLPVGEKPSDFVEEAKRFAERQVRLSLQLGR